jgi:hypothetical protein
MLNLVDMKAYRERVLPAVQGFKSGTDLDSLIGLLEEALQRPHPDKESRIFVLDIPLYQSVLERFRIEGGGNLDWSIEWGTAKRSILDIFNWNIAPSLVRFFCLIRKDGQVVEQEMSKDPLLLHLYAGSEWIVDFFTFAIAADGGVLEVPIGDSSEILSTEQVEKLCQEVLAAGRPSSKQQSLRYDSLLDLLRNTMDNENLSVVLSVL